MYCRKCGMKISDSSKFCDHCGTEVIKVKQKSYSEKYNEKKSKEKSHKVSKLQKHLDIKNPYISAALFASVVAFILAFFPWNYISKGIGTSLPMRIAVVCFALLADYHVTKAKQVNNLIYSKHGVRLKENVVSLTNFLSIFITVIGLFALFTY